MDNARTIRALAGAMGTSVLALGEIETLAFLCTCAATKGEIAQNGLSYLHVTMLEKRGLVKRIEKGQSLPFVATQQGHDHIIAIAVKVERALIREKNEMEKQEAATA